MSDLRTELERLGERARLRSDAFERLERRRRRTERNRRIAAGAVAFIVAVAGSLTAFAVFRDSEPRVAGQDGAGSFHAIWPESSYEEALAVQEAIDAGDQSLAWRLDAAETALAFARDALGWTDAEVIDPSVAAFGDGTWIAVRQPPASCQRPQGSGCRGPEATVELRQHFGPGGIWSLVSARSDEFLEVPTAGTELVVGANLEIPVQPPTPNMYAAFVGLDTCRGWEQDVITPPDATITLTAPDLPDVNLDGCDIALVVLHADEGSFRATGLGQQLLEFGLRSAVWGVLAIPMRLVPQASPPAPDVATFTCDGTSAALDTPQIRTQPDGVHVDFVNTADEPLVFTFRFPDEVNSPDSSVSDDGPGSDGDVYEPGRIRTVGLWAPGTYSLVCWNPSTGEIAAIAQLDVVDPAGHYVPWEPECDGAGWGMASSYAAGATGDRGDPLDVARARLTGLEAGDVVERALYPVSTTDPVTRIVRGGKVVAAATLFDDGQGGWLLGSLEGCGEVQTIGWSSGDVDITSGDADPAACGALATDVTIVARDDAFEPACVAVPAGESFTITLVNGDGDVPHNVSIYLPGANDPLFVGNVCHEGRLTDEVQGLAAGTYLLVDDAHPGTTGGTLVVE